MTDRELIGVFWATCATIPVILLIVWGVNRGLDQQERESRIRDISDDLYESITAPQKADSPKEQPTQQGLR